MCKLMEQCQQEMELKDDDDDQHSILTPVPESLDSSTQGLFGAEQDHIEDEHGHAEAMGPHTPEPHSLVKDKDDPHDRPL